MTNTKQVRIGMFDSGVGGLTVLKEMMRSRPYDLFVYFGDTARFPYGNKSRETITQYAAQNAHFLIEKGVDLIVVACNTASAHALAHLQKLFSLPVVGVIDAAVLEAVKKTRNHKIGIIGTRGTITSGVYEKKIKKLLPSTQITTRACPLLVTLVEEHFISKKIAQDIIREYLKPMKEAAIDTLLLACTHYPLLKKEIAEEMGLHVHIVDPAVALAEEVKILPIESNHSHTISFPTHQFFVSDSPERFQEVSAFFLGTPLETMPQLVGYNEEKICYL